MKNRALFILSGNLSTTPRAVKSIIFFCNQFSIDILQINRSHIWEQKDSAIIQEHSLNVKSINLGRKPLLIWLIATFLHRINRTIYPLFRNNLLVNSYASNKASILLWRHLKRRHRSYDVVFAHSAGSLFPAWRFGDKVDVPFYFDVEDYHPGELIRIDASNERRRREYLMKRLLRKAKGITTASPLIGKYTLKLIGGHPNHKVILNSFSQSEFKAPEANEIANKIKIVWFSQKISAGRGLEQLFGALIKTDKSAASSFGLTLIGEMDEVFKQSVIIPAITHLGDQFDFSHIESLPQVSLHSELQKHDVGLSLEFAGNDFNRELCLTNKIMAYAQAGLYILATDTKAQVDFLNDNPYLGAICGQSANLISHALQQITKQQSEIQKGAMHRFEMSKNLAWEKERVKLNPFVSGF